VKLGQLAARAVIGGLFIGHGTQKLFGWFGGPGMAGTEQMMTALNMNPPHENALAAGLSETVGGALLAAGVATPLAASSLIGTMITAIRKVHQPNGPWVANGGYEYNLVLIAALVALVESGPGELSLDHALSLDTGGLKWALAALGIGAAASTAAIAVGSRQPAASTTPAAPEAQAAAGGTGGDPATVNA
jgi:putative oxidoreductase